MEERGEGRGFSCGRLVGGTLQLREEEDVLTNREVLEQHVVLGTHTHRLADTFHVVKNIVTVDRGAVVAVGGVRADQTSQHADGGGLARTVVAQQGEDLVLIHAEAQVVDRHLGAKGLTKLVDHHSGRAQELLVGRLCRDGRRSVGSILLGQAGNLDIVKLLTGLREPVRGHHREVPRLGDSDLGGPHLGEVPGQDGVNEDVRHHDAANGADVDSVVRFQERTSSNLQGDGRHKAANDLGRLVRNRSSVHGEHHDVDDKQTEQGTKGGLTTGLWGVKERADEEGERHGGQAVHEQQTKDGAEVGTVEETANSEQRAQEGHHES
mmetsp:Transcript_55252/g.96811  ORF Transcript_55252/g.96811 Transcript_55252/m.96811 type:complete len:323 (-) Transcript_55252:295-1263(-)